MTFSSTATKPDLQILLLSKPSSDELVVVQSKLQLIELERTAQKEKLELERTAQKEKVELERTAQKEKVELERTAQKEKLE